MAPTSIFIDMLHGKSCSYIQRGNNPGLEKITRSGSTKKKGFFFYSYRAVSGRNYIERKPGPDSVQWQINSLPKLVSTHLNYDTYIPKVI
jgi:hypothetical protein